MSNCLPVYVTYLLLTLGDSCVLCLVQTGERVGHELRRQDTAGGQTFLRLYTYNKHMLTYQ